MINKDILSTVAAVTRIQQQMSRANTVIQRNIELNKQVSKGFKKYENGLANFKLLVSRDWYISTRVIDNLELSSISELFEFTKKSNLIKFENYIISSFDERKENVFEYLKNTFPNRTQIFEEILKLYNDNLFTSLIPLCFCQADGMSNEKWGFAFFDIDRNNKHELKVQTLKSKKKLLSKAISNQLKQPKNELTMWSKDKKFSNERLKLQSINRHLIIHGHSINYGKRENAIRVILLLEFICDLVNDSFQS